MKKSFTKEYVKSNIGCYTGDKIAALLEPAPDNITIEYILNSNISFEDKLWFIINRCELNMQQRKYFAVACAELALPIYETTYPNDNRVRDCIEATKQYIDGNISLDELLEKREAAYAAANAIDAASTAAFAAFAAAHSVYWSAYWTVNVIGKDKMMQYLTEFVNKID